MKQMSLSKAALAASAFACVALLSFGWSEHGGVSLSVESAQARVGRPMTPMSGAGVARRHARHAVYRSYGGGYGAGYAPGVVGAGLAGAAAVGTAAAVAATQPLGWGGAARPYYATQAYYGGPIETKPFYLPQAYYANGPWYGYSGWDDYKTRNGLACTPGQMFKGADGQMQMCQ